MKVIIAGSRNFGSVVDTRSSGRYTQYIQSTDTTVIEEAVKASGFSILEVVSGAARGVDRLGELWAKKHSLKITQFIPDWDKWGKSAGFWRNNDMADYGEALIAIWDGSSKGTAHMIQAARNRKLKVFIYEPNKIRLS